jgi:serine/threonine protein kinase
MLGERVTSRGPAVKLAGMLGEVIHGYRIDRALSADKGGFGDVFFATHVDSGAEAVVKVLKPEMSARHDIVTRFFNEARAAASVHHPGIVLIHNVGYHGDRAYLLMERLRGDDLENRLTAGPLPLDRALVFMRQAAGAIGAAHERGIVHRDLKPANLFVVADPDVVGGERVKVLDFGIAKLTVEAGAGKTQGVFGTPSYMSPEQCASTAAVDGRADLYSLGCIFYELVCGRPPFGHGGLEVIAAHLRDAPMPPRAIAPWVPPAVEQIILRLLEKQPDRRYPSCAALIAAIDQAAAGVAPSGHTPSTVPTTPSPANAATSRPPLPGAPTVTAAPTSAAQTLPPKRGTALGLGIAAVVLIGVAVAVTAIVARSGSTKAPDNAGRAVAVAVAADAAVSSDPTMSPDAPPAIDAAVVEDAAPPIDAAAPPVVAASPRREVPRGRPATDPQKPAVQDVDLAYQRTEEARKLNEEGKAAIYAGNDATAAIKFRDALSRSPNPQYAINLCAALLQALRLPEALAACNAVERYGPTADQRAKKLRLLDKIREVAATNHIALP